VNTELHNQKGNAPQASTTQQGPGQGLWWMEEGSKNGKRNCINI